MISWDEQQMSRVVSLTTAAAQGSAKSISRRAQWLLLEASACLLGGLFGEGGGQGRSPALGCPIPASAPCWDPGGHPVGVTGAVHAPRAPGIPAVSLFRSQPPTARFAPSPGLRRDPGAGARRASTAPGALPTAQTQIYCTS